MVQEFWGGFEVLIVKQREKFNYVYLCLVVKGLRGVFLVRKEENFFFQKIKYFKF